MTSFVRTSTVRKKLRDSTKVEFTFHMSALRKLHVILLVIVSQIMQDVTQISSHCINSDNRRRDRVIQFTLYIVQDKNGGGTCVCDEKRRNFSAASGLCRMLPRSPFFVALSPPILSHLTAPHHSQSVEIFHFQLHIVKLQINRGRRDFSSCGKCERARQA